MRATNRVFFLAVLLAMYGNLPASEALASCVAQDSLQNNLPYADTLSASTASRIVCTATTPVWKTISVGTLSSNSAVHDAFRAGGCGIGDSAEEMLSQMDFDRNVTKSNVDLVALSLAELGFQNDEASLTAIYSRALKLGFQIAAAEVGPQLRLQYSNQPLGEFLDIGMTPITYKVGTSGIFILANGGAGLSLIGRQADLNGDVYTPSRMVFVRPIFSENGHQ